MMLTHYEDAAIAQIFVETWKTPNGKINAERFEHELFRLQYQPGPLLDVKVASFKRRAATCFSQIIRFASSVDFRGKGTRP